MAESVKERVVMMPDPKDVPHQARVHIVVSKTDEAMATLLKALTLFVFLCGVPLTSLIWQRVIG